MKSRGFAGLLGAVVVLLSPGLIGCDTAGTSDELDCKIRDVTTCAEALLDRDWYMQQNWDPNTGERWILDLRGVQLGSTKMVQWKTRGATNIQSGSLTFLPGCLPGTGTDCRETDTPGKEGSFTFEGTGPGIGAVVVQGVWTVNDDGQFPAIKLSGFETSADSGPTCKLGSESPASTFGACRPHDS